MAKKRKTAEISIDINANVAQLSKDMNRAVSELDKMQRKLASMQKVLTASFALDLGKTLFPAVKGFVQLLGTISGKGEEVASIADQFERLGGSAEQIDVAKKATQGLVTSFDLMKIANEGLLKQIPGLAENFGLIADYGARVADTLGIDTSEAIKQVVDALGQAKEKQLQALGITINAEEAYAKYATQIGVTAKTLSDAQKQEARQIAALEQLDTALGRLAPAGDSVANSMDAVKVALEEGFSKFAIAINSNEELMKAYRNLADTLDDVDWVALGTAASEFFTTVLKYAAAALPTIIQWVKEIHGGFQLIFGDSIQAQADRAAIRLVELQKQMDKIDKSSIGPSVKEQRRKKLQEEYDAENTVYKRLTKQINDQAEASTKAAQATSNITVEFKGLNDVVIPAIKNTEKSGEALGEQAKSAAKAKAELEKLNGAWGKYLRSTQIAQDNEADLGMMGDSEYLQLRDRMTEVVRQDFYEEWKDKMDLGGQHYEDVMKAANEEVNRAAAALDKKRFDEQQRRINQIRDNTKAALANVYSGMGELGEQLGVDLGGIFEVLQNKFGDDMADIMGDLAKQLGMTGENAGAALADYIGVGLQVLNSGLAAKGRDKATKSNAGTGAAVGMGGGAIIGGIFGGPAGAMLGAQIGQVAGTIIGGMIKWGPQNADTQSRHVFANWLEEQLKQLSAITVRMANGQYGSFDGNLMNFVEGDSSRFNQPGWAEDMKKWGDDAFTMFNGLGNAIKGLLGITEDVGGQIAYLLGENLGGNIDNARMLVYQLGLSFEQLSDALLKMAQKGQITWQEYITMVGGLDEAFKPGLKGVNDMTGAMNQLFGSGGRGMGAIKAVKNVVQEAIDGGAKTVEDLRKHLIAGGLSAEDADKIVQVFRANGVTMLKEVENMTEMQIGGIVAGIGNSVDTINDKWKEMGTNLEKIKVEMDNLPTEKDIQINFKATFDENFKKAQEMGLMKVGNQKLEPVAPPSDGTKAMSIDRRQTTSAMSSVNASPNTLKAQSFNISIDARGAEAGVEQKIYDVVNSYSDAIARQAASIVMDNQVRGG